MVQCHNYSPSTVGVSADPLHLKKTFSVNPIYWLKTKTVERVKQIAIMLELSGANITRMIRQMTHLTYSYFK